MNVLTWSESTQRGSASYNNIAFGIQTKPALSFQYDGLYYEDLRQAYIFNNVWSNLTGAQIAEVENFIASAYRDSASKVLGLDATGLFIGWVQPSQAASTVPFAPPTPAECWLWNTTTKQFDYIYAVDASGYYLGNIPTSDSRYQANAGSAPPDQYSTWNFTANAWVYALAGAQARKAAEISAACAAQITGGQQSSALGTSHIYPTRITDQSNLSASILDSLLPINANNTGYLTPFWCMDATGAWAWVNHTAAQIQQVGQDIKAAILAAQNKNASLQAQVTATTTVDAVNAITW